MKHDDEQRQGNRVYKKKPKTSPADERRKEEQEGLDKEFNASADKKGKKVREEAQRVLRDTDDFLARLDNLIGPGP